MNSKELSSSDPMLTDAERDYVVRRLLAYAKHESKKLSNARDKTLHPELVKAMKESMAEAMRLAMKLQALS